MNGPHLWVYESLRRTGGLGWRNRSAIAAITQDNASRVGILWRAKSTTDNICDLGCSAVPDLRVCVMSGKIWISRYISIFIGSFIRFKWILDTASANAFNVDGTGTCFEMALTIIWLWAAYIQLCKRRCASSQCSVCLPNVGTKSLLKGLYSLLLGRTGMARRY